jgi:hypothetical protein
VSNCGQSVPFIYVADIRIVAYLYLSFNVTNVPELRRIKHTQGGREMCIFKGKLEGAE